MTLTLGLSTSVKAAIHRIVSWPFLIVSCLLVITPTMAHGISVSPPVRISQPGMGPHTWWQIAASPDGERVIVCSLRNRPEIASPLQSVLYGSEDAGTTWSTLYAATVATSEVACALGRDRAIYFTDSKIRNQIERLLYGQTLLEGSKHEEEAMQFRRSMDFGATWEMTSKGEYADSAVVLVRPGDKPEKDAVAMFYTGRGGSTPSVSISSDGAQRFGTVVRLSHPAIRPASSKWNWLHSGAVLPDGTLGAISSDHRTTRYLALVRVAPDGTQLGHPVVIDKLTTEEGNELSADGITPSIVSRRYATIAVGRVPHSATSRIYVAWHDVRDGAVRLLFSTSDDNGVTWTPSRVVGDSANRGTVGSHPSLAVNAQGIVGIQWAELEGRCWRFAASHDGGISFSSSVPINSCSSGELSFLQKFRKYVRVQTDLSVQAKRPGILGGPLRFSVLNWRTYWRFRTIALAAAGSTFYAAWVPFGDGEDALHVSAIRTDDDAATRRQRIIESVTRDLKDVIRRRTMQDSTSVLDFTHVDYDERTREFEIAAVLVRPKRQDFEWPMVLIVKDLKSRFGAIRVGNSDNGEPGPGAAWVFDGPAGILPKGSSAAMNRITATRELDYSAPRTLRFRLIDSQSQMRGGLVDAQPLSVEVEVFHVTPRALSSHQ